MPILTTTVRPSSLPLNDHPLYHCSPSSLYHCKTILILLLYGHPRPTTLRPSSLYHCTAILNLLLNQIRESSFYNCTAILTLPMNHIRTSSLNHCRAILTQSLYGHPHTTTEW
ncbi:hypothetical protein DPMN_007162 [Dreissena polymorpha]|uniref:Uncharacterized protein n=1 Tax=Dreissena polymorpha TaxID=45954 RepID=A0A9D4MVQ1_DREPO|nr:hypothetical protein DPMN_007162 [Dreissena polymorpha]